MKKVFGAAAGLLCAAVLLCGCGKKGGSKGVEMIIENGAEPQSVDPTQIQGTTEDHINMALFEGLVRPDAHDCHAVPAIAESWDRSADGTVLTFHLRKDVTWSDGTPINAKTFVDSWLYYLAPSTAAVYAYMPAGVIKGAEAYNMGEADAGAVGIRAVDDYTFEVTLTGPAPYAVEMMTHYSFGPLPLHAISKYGSDWVKPQNFVCNGPFVLESWTPQEKLTVVKNEKYWDKANVFIDRMTFLPNDDMTTAYNKYKAGEIDWNMQGCFPLDMLDEVKLRDDYQVSPNLGSYYAEFNCNDPVLKDVRVRRALAMALDTQELVDKVTKGGQLATGAFVPEMAGYTPADGIRYDVAEARRLLAEAGYPDGRGFPRMTYIYNTNEGHKKIAEWAQQQWKTKLGIDVDLQNMEWATFLAKRQANDFQIARAGWNGDYQDASNFLELFITNSGNNDGRYSNAAFDKLMEDSKTQSGARRMQTLRDAETLMLDEAAVAPMYIYVTQNLIDLNKWDGWYANTMDRHTYIGLKRK